MRVLMLSIDRALVGEKGATTDAVARHRAYAAGVERLSIIVLTKPGYEREQLSDNLFIYPTNSESRVRMLFDTYRIATSLFREERFDLIVAQAEAAPIGEGVKKKFHTPLVISMHAADTTGGDWSRSVLSGFWRVFVDRALRAADAVRVVSEGVRKRLIERGVPENRISVIPTPVETKRFHHVPPLRVEKIRSSWPGKELVLFVGRLEKVKHISLLLEAFKNVREKRVSAQLLIIGSGNEEHALKKQTDELGIGESVSFVGPVDPDHMPAYFHAGRLLVLPSFSESLGKVLIEAGAAGLPVVATDTVGAREVVKDRVTGFIVPHGDVGTLAQRIQSVLTDTALAQQLGKAAVSHVNERFGWEENINKIIQLWKSVV